MKFFFNISEKDTLVSDNRNSNFTLFLIILRHLASKYFQHYRHTCFLYVWIAAVNSDTVSTVSTYFFRIIDKGVNL